jgi:hypothetical protein
LTTDFRVCAVETATAEHTKSATANWLKLDFITCSSPPYFVPKTNLNLQIRRLEILLVRYDKGFPFRDKTAASKVQD